MTQREEFERVFLHSGLADRDKHLCKAFWNKGFLSGVEAAKAQAVPEGWKLVPIDPTQEMFDAAFHAPSVGHPETSGQSYGSIYKAMVSAAPEQQK